MKKYERRRHLGVSIAFCCLWLLLEGCSPKSGGLPEGLLETPELHAFNGFRLIKKERLVDAQREFEHALRLKPGYSPALRGMGLVQGMKGNFASAYELMEQAKNSAEKEEDEALAYVGIMQLHAMKRGPAWLDRVEENFVQASSFTKDLPEAYYHMGMAYKYAYRFTESEAAFEQVLKINTSLQDEAEEQLERVRKIERAMPRTELGRRIAVLDRITRADAAALLIHEVRVEIICKGGQQSGRDDAGAAARGPSRKGSHPLPLDVMGHPLKGEIERVLQLEIEGLKTFDDGSFGPNEYVTRADFAVIVADVIAKKEGEPLMVGRYSGVVSPFKDLRHDAAYFNAVMTCTMRGRIMEGENGLFDPTGTLSGADALLSIRKLKRELNIF